ncbi:hypothetical protein [Pelomonas sp. Root1444]|uniref:hypothetical protein n=1 Tax=Pelomonas sp. Root1444 TaxID=1736464 RepID=UPI000AF52B03|nr:hypothetical protein [Pelomonas sp. Root1444]
MFLDLKDVDSIINWWAVFPARHDGALKQMLILRSQFAATIRAARRTIASREDLQAKLSQSLAQEAQHRAHQEERTSRMSSVEMLRRELVAA